MESAFSILGLVLSSASALWLLIHEIGEKNRAAHVLLKKAEVASQRKALRSDLKQVRDNLTKANALLDPSGVHERYSIKERTRDFQRELEAIDQRLEIIDDPDKSLPYAWPSRAHFGAFVLLLVGFMFQLLAEMLKAVK